MSEQAAKKLTNKQRIFIDEYLRSFNATRAAKAAGYSEKTAYSIGQRLLRNVEIKDEIEQRLAASHISADEALQRLADFARADIGDLIDNNGLMDIREARDKGLTKLIKKIKQKTVTRIGKTDNDDDVEITEIEFEMYDAQAANRDALKVHGKFTDRIDLTNNGKDLPEPKVDDERFSRAIEGLAKAIRTTLPDKNDGETGHLDTAE